MKVKEMPKVEKMVDEVLFDLSMLINVIKEYKKELGDIKKSANKDYDRYYDISKQITGSIKHRGIECKKQITRLQRNLETSFYNESF